MHGSTQSSHFAAKKFIKPMGGAMFPRKCRSDHTEIASSNAVICILLDIVVHLIYNYASDAGNDPQKSLNWIHDELQRALAETKFDTIQDQELKARTQIYVKETAQHILKESFQQAADLLEISAPNGFLSP
ncbi:hypothetical protein [Methylobacterium brachythecii]|uniref:Uncharacterized protein n=1 Tax=Methylobacterium brachythecii TaxID=1176177 RepID=A0A7W6APB1_9HYPH|nr:hypothetical protein [Methylobacterium brachythecii]MBB3904785.1 hypothetical protein [Methylobacterium brachythecii]